MSTLAEFTDIIEARRINGDAVGFMTKHWKPQPAYRPQNFITPAEIKSITLQSRRLGYVLDRLAITLNRSHDDIAREVAIILEEIGLDRKMFVVRSLGIFTTKVLCKICNSVLVNDRQFFGLKSTMGMNPVVFVPTHRSYADFILMTYLCYCFEIELPAVAAGMDFHSMVGMGRVMRDTCAFYIRRTFATDKLYGAVFRQYVRTLITKYHAPISFFIEGTRSRSGKSLPPKYGFMSMVLEPFFAREIPDITFVPVSFSYNRVMEERLFAYELLGVPKPKESTSGLLKALSILNEQFGDIYVNVGKSISAKEYFGDSYKRNIHSIKPLDLISLTPEENILIQNLSHEIIRQQQSIYIITTFQVIAVAISISVQKSAILTTDDLSNEVIWLSDIIRLYGGNTSSYDIETVGAEIITVLSSHRNLVQVNQESQVKLVNTTPFIMTDEIRKKMKGYQLNEKTMSNVIPVLMTQLYSNPILPYLITPGLIYILLIRSPLSKDDLWKEYNHIRILLKCEFPMNEQTLRNNFESALKKSIEINLLNIRMDGTTEMLLIGNNKRLQEVLRSIFWPFLNCIQQLIAVLLKFPFIEEKGLIKAVQESVEHKLLNEGCTHPYCLSMDTILNCIQGIVAEGSITKERKETSITYHKNSEKMILLSTSFNGIMKDFDFVYELNNPIISNHIGIFAKL